MTTADEPTAVALAHIDGRLDTLTQTVELRIRQVAEDATAAKRAAKSAHERLDVQGQHMRDEFRFEIRELHELIGSLQTWRAKIVGIGQASSCR